MRSSLIALMAGPQWAPNTIKKKLRIFPIRVEG